MSLGSTPAIVGAAQCVQRPGDWTEPADAQGPIELMTAAARRAADDSGAPALLNRIDWIAVVGGFWGYRNPGRLIAQQLGSVNARTALAAISGTSPQELVGIAAERIARGELEVALVVGGEAQASRKRLRAAGEQPSWIVDADLEDPEHIGEFEAEMIEEMRVLGVAATAYALLDDSLRLARGDSIGAHRDRISELWAGFSTIASRNPFAWDRDAKSAAAIREPTPDNRWIAFPYTKALVANNTVDMASAVLLCSVDTAKAAGINRDRLVFPHVSTTSHETWQVINRHLLHEAPALKTAGHAALRSAGLTVEQLDHVDLYACFPAIVRMSADAMGIDTARALTVTGGLGFAGAPVANSSGQAVAAMVPLLREGGWGFIHANGGNATKHAFGVYSAQPPKQFARIDAQDQAELHARPAVGPDWAGEGVVEAATVVFDRDGPSHVIAAIRSCEGLRGFVRSSDSDLINAAMTAGLGDVEGPLPGATRLDTTGR
jgi:acetyl-CoA C-acetyltransferase